MAWVTAVAEPAMFRSLKPEGIKKRSGSFEYSLLHDVNEPNDNKNVYNIIFGLTT